MYYGAFRWGDKLCPSIHEPFTTKELFERANKALSLFERPRVTTRIILFLLSFMVRIRGSLLEYFYNFFSTNVIYWHILLSRRERTLKNGQKGPSYNFLQGVLQS